MIYFLFFLRKDIFFVEHFGILKITHTRSYNGCMFMKLDTPIIQKPEETCKGSF